MKNNLKTRSAFSLIELSIVILVIGILIAGVTQGSRLISKSRFSNARTLTQSSPVSSIKNLALWIETTSESSLDDIDTESGATVDNWYDINPQASVKSSLTSSAQPTYTTTSTGNVNSLPTVTFNGSSTFMSSSNFGNIVDQSSVFMVVKTPSGTPAVKPIFSKRATSGAGAINIQVNTGLATDGWQYCDNYAGTACYASTSDVAASTAYVVSMVYIANTASTGMRFFQNGVSGGASATTSKAPDTTVSASLFIGKDGLSSSPAFFGGSIGELIIFDRALKDEERQSIEDYLGKKWGISISR